MSELSWLIDLLINHKLSATTKAHVIERIGYVETLVNTKPYVPFVGVQQGQAITADLRGVQIINGAPQSPSTIAAMQKHGMVEPSGAAIVHSVVPVEQPCVVAATPQTAAAMASRQQAIEMAMSGKNEKGRTSPRKF